MTLRASSPDQRDRKAQMRINWFIIVILATVVVSSSALMPAAAQPVSPSASPVSPSSAELAPVRAFSLLSIGFGELIAILGIGLAIVALPPVASRVWRTGPRLAFQARSDELVNSRIQPFIESIRVRHGRKSIERLTLTTLVLWNAGREAVRENDLDGRDPLRFVFEDDAQILEWKLVEVSRKGMTAAPLMAQPRRNELVLGVPYFNPGDGLVLDIWHTGTSMLTHPCGSIQGPARWFESRGMLGSIGRPPSTKFQHIATQAFALSFFFIFFLDISSVQFRRGFPAETGRLILQAISILLMVPELIVIWVQSRTMWQEPPHVLSFAARFSSAGAMYRLYRDVSN